MKVRYVFLCLPLFLLLSCGDNNTDPDNPGQDTCYYKMYSKDDPFSSILVVHETRAYNFAQPCFNPINPDEFVYIRYTELDPTGNFELRKHTISTGQDVVLCDINKTSGLISWDKAGWIYFCKSNNIVWRVNGNGGPAEQFSPVGGMFRPSASPNGDYIILHQLLGPSAQTVVLDNSGNFIDTIGSGYIAKTWVNDSTLFIVHGVYPQQTYVWKLLSYPEKNILDSGDIELQTEILAYIGNNQVMYAAGGYSVFSMNTSFSKKFKEHCGYNAIYSTFSYDLSTEKILCERLEVTAIDTNTRTFHVQYNIVLLNKDGTNEQVINLPQQ